MKVENNEKFIYELKGLLNEHGIDNELNIPDSILAMYISRVIDDLNKMQGSLYIWNGRKIENETGV